MRTKHLRCVLIHIRIKSEAGTVDMFKPSSFLSGRSKAVLLLWTLFIMYFSCLFLLCLVCSLQRCDHLLGKD